MPRTTTTLLANSLEPLIRSLLLSLGLDHALIDFLVIMTIGAATVVLTIFFVSFRIPNRLSRKPDERLPDHEI